jgi:hypothetical protein
VIDFDVAISILTKGGPNMDNHKIRSVMEMLQSASGGAIGEPSLHPEEGHGNVEEDASSSCRLPPGKFQRGGSHPQLLRSMSAQSAEDEDQHGNGDGMHKSASVPSHLGSSRHGSRAGLHKKHVKHGHHGNGKNVLITQLNMETQQARDIPFFGNLTVASVYIKRAQARLLVTGENDMEELRYHNAALCDAEQVCDMRSSMSFTDTHAHHASFDILFDCEFVFPFPHFISGNGNISRQHHFLVGVCQLPDSPHPLRGGVSAAGHSSRHSSR